MENSITRIEIRNLQYVRNSVAQFYFNAKTKKYPHAYGWDEVEKDIDLAVVGLSAK